MHKWIMVTLVFGAFTLGLGVLFVQGAYQQPTAQEQANAEPAMPQVTLDANAAKNLYGQSCIACHGTDLQGAVGPNLQKVGSKLSGQQLYKTIQNGRASMPAFKGTLKDEEIANLALWLEGHK
ncbi:c-type cytochrome [Ferviditalea candida]|uniref:Cytochrome c n=1 Tax=Ferviditalea candida TaxID=3108399 RepID=A0ABU5ZHU6_9BACL|nr:cytochrome c [Paenibacillaceae bacterium T2]